MRINGELVTFSRIGDSWWEAALGEHRLLSVIGSSEMEAMQRLLSVFEPVVARRR